MTYYITLFKKPPWLVIADLLVPVPAPRAVLAPTTVAARDAEYVISFSVPKDLMKDGLCRRGSAVLTVILLQK